MDDVLAAALADASGQLAKTSDESINLVSMLAHKQLRLEAEVKSCEEKLKALKADLTQVSERDLPNALLDMGARGFTLKDGAKIEVNKVYTASIKAEDKAEAFSWLCKYGHDALIKKEISIPLGKESSEFVERIMAEIKLNYDVNVALEQSVHWQTLRAFVKEQVTGDDAASFPQELFGVHIIDKAKIILPKS
jgi:hypothetical protein